MAQFMYEQQDPQLPLSLAGQQTFTSRLRSWQLLLVSLLFGLGSVSSAQADYLAHTEVAAFIDEMVSEEGFSAAELKPIFADASFKQGIVDAMSRPAERVLTWETYQDIFLTERRVREGHEFMQKYHTALERARQKYGVPPEIITAIIGVETMYGSNKGHYRVIDALATLAFDYPPRSTFFRSELKHFLLLAREEHLSPLAPVGSYAGAMGYGQFISSSYREYAVDFDADGLRDIWENPIDAIGSVANYLSRHGWQADATVVLRTPVPATAKTTLAGVYNVDLKPSTDLGALRRLGVVLDGVALADDTRVSPMRLEGKQGDEYWLGLQNFYVITRYNHSELYAMAVFQLSERLGLIPQVAEVSR